MHEGPMETYIHVGEYLVHARLDCWILHSW